MSALSSVLLPAFVYPTMEMIGAPLRLRLRLRVARSAATRDGFPELLARCEEILWRHGRVQAPGREPEFLRTRQ